MFSLMPTATKEELRGYGSGKKVKDRIKMAPHISKELEKNRKDGTQSFGFKELQEEIEIFDFTKQTNATKYPSRQVDKFDQWRKEENLSKKDGVINYLASKEIDTETNLNKLKLRLNDTDESDKRHLLGLLFEHWVKLQEVTDEDENDAI